GGRQLHELARIFLVGLGQPQEEFVTNRTFDHVHSDTSHSKRGAPDLGMALRRRNQGYGATCTDSLVCDRPTRGAEDEAGRGARLNCAKYQRLASTPGILTGGRPSRLRRSEKGGSARSGSAIGSVGK